MADKTSWPELVGETGENAKAAILKDNPNLQVHIIGEKSPVTMDFNPERVRIVTKEDGTVASTPQTG